MTDLRIIAEAGVNHDGNVEKALALVETARNAGADYIKFQLFDPAKLTSRTASLAPYQAAAQGAGGSQQEMLKSLTLTPDEIRRIKKLCDDMGIAFTATPFDLENLRFLHEELKPPFIKVGSGDLTNAPLLHAAARTGRDIVLSTGMGNLRDIEIALGVMAHGYLEEGLPDEATDFPGYGKQVEARKVLKERVILLQCTTAYPTPMEDANLRALHTLRGEFGLEVGYSDHTLGVDAALGAVALGARMIEKHFTLDKNTPGPDHSASLEPMELSDFVERLHGMIRALGSGEKAAQGSEAENLQAARRSIVAACSIKPGEIFTTDNLAVKRPGGGLAPDCYWSLLGRMATRLYMPDEMIEEE